MRTICKNGLHDLTVEGAVIQYKHHGKMMRGCFACLRAAQRRNASNWKKKHRSHICNYISYARERYRQMVLDAYGNKCSCCGESTPEFLTVEHVGGGGAEHRKKFKNRVYWHIVQEGFPNKYTVYCANCNHATSRGRVCPHQRQKEEVA